MSSSVPGIGAQGGPLAEVTQATNATPGGSSVGSSDFFNELDSMMQQAGGMPNDYESQVTTLMQGNGQDLHTAMIAVEKADLSFQLMMQVRNRIIAAYQTIQQIPF
jgi:flagellar hook-basal body complex protein FliE